MRRSPFAVLAVLSVISACQAQFEPVRLSTEDALADIALLIDVMRDVHPGYTRYASESELADAEAVLRHAVRAPSISEGDLYLAVARYLATIRCEHTEAELPEPMAAYRAQSPTQLPVAFELAEDRAIITASAVDAIAPGDELLAISGVTIDELRARIEPLISVDGFTDHTRPFVFAGVDDIGLTTLDVFWPLLYGFTDSFDLLVRREGGEATTVRAPAITEQASRELHGLDSMRNFSDDGAVAWRMLDDRSAYLAVETFVNYRTPVDPDEVFGRVMREIKASGAERLVVDLRRCGGGSDDAAASLLRHLIDRPIRVGGPARVRTYRFDNYREHLSTWNQEIFELPEDMFTREGELYLVDEALAGGARTIEPAPEAWRGRLVLLIGPGNASGATMLIAQLAEQRELTTVGEPTGGSAEGCTAGQILFLMLPSSRINVRVPLIRSRTSVREFEPGMGVVPDVFVTRSVEDIRGDRDPALAAAGRSR